MRLKKIVSLMSCVILTTTMMFGCGGAKQTSSSSTAVSEKPTELVWYTIGAEPSDLNQVLEKANEYLKEKINVTLDMRFIDFGDYNQKMSVVINSGEPYDLAFTCSWAGDYLGNARKGAFLDLTKYLDTTGKDMYEAIDKRFWDGATIDGKIYAVPTQKEISNVQMWRFTKEYVDKYNIPYKDLHTLQDLEPWLKLIKENEPDVTPLYISNGVRPPQMFDEIVEPVGVEFNDETLTVKNLYETKYLREQLDTLRKYYKLGYINADAATQTEEATRKYFVSKADGQPYAENIWSEQAGRQIVTSNITNAYITNGSTTGSMIAVSANSKNKEKSVEFLNLLNTDPYLKNLIVNGIEGVHYNKVSDNQIEYTDNHKNYDVSAFAFGNLFINYILKDEPTTKWEEFKKFNDESIPSTALGFRFDPTNVTNEIAAITNVLGEFKPSLFSGSVDVDEYLGRMNAKLKEQGIDKVIEEMQKQIDQWKASK